MFIIYILLEPFDGGSHGVQRTKAEFLLIRPLANKKMVVEDHAGCYLGVLLDKIDFFLSEAPSCHHPATDTATRLWSVEVKKIRGDRVPVTQAGLIVKARQDVDVQLGGPVLLVLFSVLHQVPITHRLPIFGIRSKMNHVAQNTFIYLYVDLYVYLYLYLYLNQYLCLYLYTEMQNNHKI